MIWLGGFSLSGGLWVAPKYWTWVPVLSIRQVLAPLSISFLEPPSGSKTPGETQQEMKLQLT